MYHLTKWHNPDTVLGLGLDQWIAAHGMFGRGIYLSAAKTLSSGTILARGGRERDALHAALPHTAGGCETVPSGDAGPIPQDGTARLRLCAGNMTGHNEYVLCSDNHVLVEHMVGYGCASNVRGTKVYVAWEGKSVSILGWGVMAQHRIHTLSFLDVVPANTRHRRRPGGRSIGRVLAETDSTASPIPDDMWITGLPS